MRVHREEGAVKQDFIVPGDADRGEIFDLEIADFIRLVLDIDPAKARRGKFVREGEKPGTIVVAGIAPRGAKAAHDEHA